MAEIKKSLQGFEMAGQGNAPLQQRRHPPPIPTHAAGGGGGGGALLHGGALRVPPPLPSGAGDAAEDAGVAYLIRFGVDEVRSGRRSVDGQPLAAAATQTQITRGLLF